MRKCPHKKVRTPKKIYKDIVTTLSDDSLYYSKVNKWVDNIKQGRKSSENVTQPGWLNAVTRDDQMEANRPLSQ